MTNTKTEEIISKIRSNTAKATQEKVEKLVEVAFEMGKQIDLFTQQLAVERNLATLTNLRIERLEAAMRTIYNTDDLGGRYSNVYSPRFNAGE